MYAVMFSRARVSLPVAVMEKVWPAAVRGAVMVRVSLCRPVKPVRVTPAGRPEVSKVYPELMLVSCTVVVPLYPVPDLFRVRAEGVNSMAWFKVCLSLAICNNSSAHSSTSSGALHSRCSVTNFMPPASNSWQLFALSPRCPAYHALPS